jgi:hypothetical protein
LLGNCVDVVYVGFTVLEGQVTSPVRDAVTVIGGGVTVVGGRVIVVGWRMVVSVHNVVTTA